MKMRLFLILLISLSLGGCSKSVMSTSKQLRDGRNGDSQQTDSGTTSDSVIIDGANLLDSALPPHFSDGQVPPKAVLVNGDRAIDSQEHGTYFLVQNLARLTLPPAASTPVGTIYIIHRTVSDYQKPTFIDLNGTDTIDGLNIDLILLQSGTTIELICDGQGWHVLNSRGVFVQANYIVCGEAGNSCYQKNYLDNGYVITPTGKFVEKNVVGAWYEYRGDYEARRYLSPSGLDNWAQTLNLDGKSFTSNIFTSTFDHGRMCPVNVYIDDANKFATGKCLLFPTSKTFNGNIFPRESGALNQYGTSQTVTGQIGIASHGTSGSALWYTGNTWHCAKLGMRIATAYEISGFPSSSAKYPTNDGAPTFDQTAAPKVYADGNYFSTATGDSTFSDSYHCIQLGAPTVALYNSNSRPICVLPNHD